MASIYPEVSFSDDVAAPFYAAIRQMIESHEPFPAFVINRWWELVDANEAGRRFFSQNGEGPIDLVDTVLGPGPMREKIENFSASGWMFLRRIRKEVAESGPDDRLQEVLKRAEAYMKDVPIDNESLGSELVICPHFRMGDKLIRTVSLVARFGTAREVTLDELRVELVFPRDEVAEAFFRNSI